MTKRASLCFTDKGLVNPSELKFITENPDVDTIILHGDGSRDAMDRIIQFQSNPIFNLYPDARVGLGKTPKYSLRVLHQNGEISKPQFASSDEVRVRWFCSQVAEPHLSIYLADYSSQSNTAVKLDKLRADAVCLLAYKQWELVRIAEDRLGFPAIVIDALTRWTYQLTPETIDIEVLRQETGLKSLDYDRRTDLITVEVLGEPYQVRMRTLNDIYANLILPFFNHIYGRRARISVQIHGEKSESHDEPRDMIYGQLGLLVHQMHIFTKQERIDQHNPLPPDDLIAFARRVKIDDESCVWVKKGQSFADVIEEHHYALMPGNPSSDYVDEDDIEVIPTPA